MISKIFGKKSKHRSDNKKSELQERIERMNLTELRLYVKGKMEGLELDEEGVVEVLRRLVSKINEKRYFLDESDDDTKMKKAFDLVLLCAKSNKMTVRAIELIAEFIQRYERLIRIFDKKHKEIYEDRLKKAIDTATTIVEAKVALQNKMSMID